MEERIGRIGQICTDFLILMHGFQAEIKKNPYQSAQSAQSVLPLYRFFQKQKGLLLNNKFYN
jgi:hypothetical protein